MSTKQYWSKQKIYFYAQAVYTPDRLDGLLVSRNELKVIFPDGFEEYLSADEINNDLVKITRLYQVRFINELREYLREYSLDRLSTLQRFKPDRYSSILQRLLSAVLKKKYLEGTRPIVDLTDLWQEKNERQDGMNPFWEFILAEATYGENIDVINFGYEGSYIDSNNQVQEMPFAEINLKYGSVMYDAVTHIPKLQKAAVFNTTLEMRSYGMAVVRNGDEVPLKRLKPDMQYYNFVDYLWRKQTEPLLLADINEEVEGAKTATDLTELARLSGFDSQDKRLFFEYIKKDRLQFRPRLNMDSHVFNAFKNRKQNRN